MRGILRLKYFVRINGFFGGCYTTLYGAKMKAGTIGVICPIVHEWDAPESGDFETFETAQRYIFSHGVRGNQ